VADFLQDKDTEAAAAAWANQLLFPDLLLPSIASKEEEEALMGLPHHLLLSLLQTWRQTDACWRYLSTSGRMYCMLATLPVSCHVTAVSSCVSDSKLELDHRLLVRYFDTISAAAPDLAPKLRSLTVSDYNGGRLGVDGAFERLLSSMPFLEELSLVGCYYPWVPNSLTALTSLSVCSMRVRNLRPRHKRQNRLSFSFPCSHLSNVTALQNLTLSQAYIPDLHAFSSWLTRLPGLTGFEFQSSNIEVTVFYAGLASCTNLQALRLDLREDSGKTVSDEAASGLQRLVSCFGQLTHLHFCVRGFTHEQLASMLCSLRNVEADENGTYHQYSTYLRPWLMCEPWEPSGALQAALSHLHHLKEVYGLHYDPEKARQLG
jgi:hypothetical protein